MKRYIQNVNKQAFTLAEVLITLAIIGVIAAILFPSILANYNERTLKAKRQALVGRMSQAMGEMADTFRNYEDVTCTDPSNPTTCTDVGSAAKFVNEGFSKVYKIAAVCDNDSLTACDIPEEITRIDGTTYSIKDNSATLGTFNPQIGLIGTANSIPYDTKSAGFMTKNGESILLFYNPNCLGKQTFTSYIYAENEMCINMIYDLNGAKKKPNKMGEDIGVISVFYSDSPYVVSPRPYDYRGVPDFDTTINSSGDEVINGRVDRTFTEAKAACASLGSNVSLPSLEEGMAISVNRELYRAMEDQEVSGYFWTNTMQSSSIVWIVWLINKANYDSTPINRMLYVYPSKINDTRLVRCVYND